MTDPRVIRAKLTHPEPHPDAVERPEAQGRIDEALDRHGTLAIVTMPGYARRDLLARWIRRHDDHPIAWQSIDEWDDADRNFLHCVAALSSLHPDIGATARRVADQGTDALREIGIPSLAADIDALAGPFTWVIEGIHRLVDVEARAGMRAVQRYRPDALRIIYVTDDEAAVDLRAPDGSEQIPVLAEDDLRFDIVEIDAMFTAAGLSPSAAELDELVAATSGWPLVVLDVLDRSRRAGRVVAHDPDEPAIADRLHRAICRPLTPELHAVLSDLAVLGPVTRDRFQEVTDRTDVARSIERLRRRHLIRREHGRFEVASPIVPHLVDEREADDPVGARLLRRHLARLLADDGLAGPAVRVLERADDHDGRARLLLDRHREWSASGHGALVTRCVKDGLVHDPSLIELFLIRAWQQVFSGAYDDAEASVELVTAHPITGMRKQVVDSELAMLRALLSRRRGRMDDCLFHALAAVDIGSTVDRCDLDETWAAYSALAPDRILLYVGHCLAMAAELEDARAELLRANLVRAWSPPALAAMHAALALVGWLVDDGSASIHAAIAFSHASEQLNANDHLAAALFAIVGDGDEAATAARLHAAAVERVDEPAARVFDHVVTAVRADDPDAARVALAAARAEVERCEQPGVLAMVVARAGGMLGVAQDEIVPELGTPLTDGERRVVLALRGELTEREIAAELHLSHNTVRAYRRRAYRKLGVSTRADAVRRLADLEP